MKVKVGNLYYTSEEIPIMVVLTEQDKTNIANMPEDCFRYAQFNQEQFTAEEAMQWMKEDLHGKEDRQGENQENRNEESKEERTGVSA